jgi:hypothetical protein
MVKLPAAAFVEKPARASVAPEAPTSRSEEAPSSKRVAAFVLIALGTRRVPSAWYVPPVSVLLLRLVKLPLTVSVPPAFARSVPVLVTVPASTSVPVCPSTSPELLKVG